MGSKLSLIITCLAVLLSGVVAVSTVTAAFDKLAVGALPSSYVGLTWFTSSGSSNWYVDAPSTASAYVVPQSGSNYVRLLAGQTGVISEPSNSGNSSSAAYQTVKYTPSSSAANMTLDSKPPSCGKPDSYTFKEASGKKDVLLDSIVMKQFT